MNFQVTMLGGRAAGWLIILARERRVARRKVRTHGVLDETPNQQHQTQRLNALRSLTGFEAVSR